MELLNFSEIIRYLKEDTKEVDPSFTQGIILKERNKYISYTNKNY